MEGDERIVYSLNVRDIQDVASEILGHVLTDEQVEVVEEHVGDFIQWHDIIESVIWHFIVQRQPIP